jgi:hypothetical protein
MRTRSSFFFGMSALLLAIVLVGFAPTLYLRAFFDVPPIRAHLYLHGVIVTAWFVWLFAQATLVKARRIADHRRLGVIGAVLGLATVGALLLATLNAPSGITEAGLDFDADVSAIGVEGLGTGVPIIAAVSGGFWGNLGGALAFFVLVAAAILLRTRPDSHKRLMLLASIANMAPPLGRISRWPIFGGEQGPFVPTVLLGLLLALIGHDLLSTRRIQRATLLGGGLAILCIGGGLMIGATEWGRAVVRALA